MKKGLLLLLFSTLLFSLLLFATGCEELDYLFADLDDEKATETTEQKDIQTASQTVEQTVAPQVTTKQVTEPEAEADLVYFKRAAVTAMTILMHLTREYTHIPTLRGIVNTTICS